MKYPVIYVKNLMGVHKHSSVSYALHLRIVSDEAEDEQRAAYQKKVLTQMYHMVENQFVVAQSKIVENDGDLFVLFTSNLDQRMLKQQLQILANELGARLGPGTQLEYALFRSLLLVKGKPAGMLKATKEEQCDRGKCGPAEARWPQGGDQLSDELRRIRREDESIRKTCRGRFFYRLSLMGLRASLTCFASLSMRSSLAAEGCSFCSCMYRRMSVCS